MAKLSGTSGRGVWLAALVLAFISQTVPGHVPAGVEDRVTESHYLAEAEAEMARGESGKAAERYRDAFLEASGFEERLSLIGPLSRALWIDQGLTDWLSHLSPEGGGDGEAWEQPVLLAAVYQFWGDFSAAAAAIADASPAGEGMVRSLEEQRKVWADARGDVKEALPLHRRIFEEEPSEEHHLAYVQSLLEAGTERELASHLEERKAKLRGESQFWRSLLPELKRHDRLDLAGSYLETAWQREDEGDESDILFALAELRSFQQQLDEAKALFWTVFEMREEAEPSAMRYFRRLNSFMTHRFPVNARIDQAIGRYGSDMCRQFSLFGFGDDFHLDDAGTARDLSLLYLRELLVPEEMTSGEFLERVRRGLDRRRDRERPGERILAFAGIGAPKAMVEEIEAFVGADSADNAAAEFSLLAINRFVLSAEKFPSIRGPLADMAREVDGKFGEERSSADVLRTQELRNRILRRLGEEEAGFVFTEGSRDQYFERITRAAREGEPAEAERLYRELAAVDEDEGSMRMPLLFLADTWQTHEGDEQAAGLVQEFLEPVYARKAGHGFAMPLQWAPRGHFPPGNPYLGDAALGELGEAFDVVEGTAAKGLLKEKMAARWRELPEENRAAACLVLATFYLWSDEPDEAVSILRSGAEELEEPALHLLLGYMEGLRGDYGKAGAILEKIPAEATKVREQSRRLLFALAIVSRDAERAKAWARELEDASLQPGDRVELAAGLASLNLASQAAEWLDRVSVPELTLRDEELYQQVRLRVALDNGNHEQVIGQARFVLLGESLESIPRPSDALRLAALKALEETGHLEVYVEELEGLLSIAPEALSLHLLQGESAEYIGQQLGADRETERRQAGRKALEHFRQAVAARSSDLNLRLDFCEWLVRHGFYDQAVAEYQAILETDAEVVLVDFATVLQAHERAGKLSLLLEFFEDWEVPEARSMDEFYGLQPTEHIFRQLGEAFLGSGERKNAIHAWRKGLDINPIGFTETIRLSLAELYRENGDAGAALDLIEGYVVQANPDPHFYAIQPFASVLPRWVERMAAGVEPADTPVERLIQVVEESGDEEAVRKRAKQWRKETPESMSVVSFSLYLSARAEEEDWTGDLAEVRDRFTSEEGPLKAAWPAVEALFERFEAEASAGD